MSDVPPSLDEDTKRRQAYERKVAFGTAAIFMSVLAGGVALVLGGLDFSMPSFRLPDIDTPFSALPVVLAHKPDANPYRIQGLEEKTAQGTVTSIVVRKELWPDGTLHRSFYARTEYFLPEYAGDCYFHHYLGDEARYKSGDQVTVSYQPGASDACGTSMIME